MAVISLTSAVLALLARQSFGDKDFNMEFRSDATGTAQARLLAPSRWRSAMLFANGLPPAEAAVLRAFLKSLRGNVNQLAVYDVANPAPLGTMRGTLTVNSAIAKGDTTLSITGGAGQASTTYLKGDWFGVGTGATRQLFMVQADATANGSGVISLTVEPPARYASAGGVACTWDKPTCLMRRTTTESNWDVEGQSTSGFSLDAMESWES